MKIRKKFIVILSIILIIIIGYKLLDIRVRKNYEIHKNNVSSYNEKIGISIPEDSTVLGYNDTHGGFNGDGESYVDIQLTSKGMDTFINEANKSKKWNYLPLTQEIQQIVFGGEYEDGDYGDGLFEIWGNMPRDMKNGIYYFRDRYAERYLDEANTDINSRHSYNFTISILDLDENKLYIYEYDS